jgi:hypothetical protein
MTRKILFLSCATVAAVALTTSAIIFILNNIAVKRDKLLAQNSERHIRYEQRLHTLGGE